MLEGTNGLLYGATAYGGSNDLGTIFSIDKSGTNYQIVHHFDTNDASPRAALIQGRDGFLYGTTWNPGSIFKLNPTDGSFQVLHQFENNGFVNIQPNTALLEGSDGALYGSTGGSMFFNGHLIFKINPDGSGYQELFTFDNPTNGLDPSELIEGTDARLYGAAGF